MTSFDLKATSVPVRKALNNGELSIADFCYHTKCFHQFGTFYIFIYIGLNLLGLSTLYFGLLMGVALYPFIFCDMRLLALVIGALMQ